MRSAIRGRGRDDQVVFAGGAELVVRARREPVHELPAEDRALSVNRHLTRLRFWRILRVRDGSCMTLHLPHRQPMSSACAVPQIAYRVRSLPSAMAGGFALSHPIRWSAVTTGPFRPGTDWRGTDRTGTLANTQAAAVWRSRMSGLGASQSFGSRGLSVGSASGTSVVSRSIQ